MTKKQQFEELCKKALQRDSGYLVVLVESPDSVKPEIIINPRENLETKLAYYMRAYNDNLELNTFNKIRIVKYYYTRTIGRLIRQIISMEE